MTPFAPGAAVALPNGRWARVRFQVGRFVRVTLRPGVVRTLDVAQLSTREQVLAALRRREPAPPVPLERAPVGSLHRAMLDALASCTFLPASWDKRFVRDLQGAATLTPRQAANIERLAFRYRRQILGVDASRDINALPAEERAAAFVGFLAGRIVTRIHQAMPADAPVEATPRPGATATIATPPSAARWTEPPAYTPPREIGAERWADYNRKFCALIHGERR